MTELETREHILTIASALIAEKGFDKTSMNDIVKASGISKGGIYWHFKGKDEIILAIVEMIFTEQMHFLDEILSAEGRAIERLTGLTEMIASSIEQMPADMPSPIDIYVEALRKPDLLSVLKDYYRRYQNHFVRLIEQGNREGDFAVDNPELVAFSFMSSIEGILLLHSLLQPEHNLQQALKQATQLFLKSVQTKGD